MKKSFAKIGIFKVFLMSCIYSNFPKKYFSSVKTERQVDEIYSEALKHNLSVIIEVHDKKEAEKALKYERALIGINNRNLKTLEVSINNTLSIFEVVKSHKEPLISESGIQNEDDAKFIISNTGIKNFLIGESLLKSDNPSDLMKRLIQITQ